MQRRSFFGVVFGGLLTQRFLKRPPKYYDAAIVDEVVHGSVPAPSAAEDWKGFGAPGYYQYGQYPSGTYGFIRIR